MTIKFVFRIALCLLALAAALMLAACRGQKNSDIISVSDEVYLNASGMTDTGSALSGEDDSLYSSSKGTSTNASDRKNTDSKKPVGTSVISESNNGSSKLTASSPSSSNKVTSDNVSKIISSSSSGSNGDSSMSSSKAINSAIKLPDDIW